MARIGVIGGGVVGISCALALLDDRHAVTVFDPGPPGEGASWASCGSRRRSEPCPDLRERRVRHNTLPKRSGDRRRCRVRRPGCLSELGACGYPGGKGQTCSSRFAHDARPKAYGQSAAYLRYQADHWRIQKSRERDLRDRARSTWSNACRNDRPVGERYRCEQTAEQRSLV
jgi:glycine/D-amino acid oxidase-like deaminating enzyme